MSRELYNDVRFCGHCKKPTMHSCEDMGNEQDNYRQCQTCEWHAYGLDYVPPDEEPQ